MHNQPLKLADLIALQAENAKAPQHFKSVTKIKPLDQIPIPNIPQPAGGKRTGAGRPATAESTTVVRVPNGCLAAVQKLIAEYRNPPVLNTVTEIKLPAPEPEMADSELRRLKLTVHRYRLVVDGEEHLWSGRGRVPPAYQHYMQKHGYRNYKDRSWLDALLIEQDG